MGLSRIEAELKKTDDAIVGLLQYFEQILTTMDRQKLITMMRMCYQKGIYQEILKSEKIRRILLEEDDDDQR